MKPTTDLAQTRLRGNSTNVDNNALTWHTRILWSTSNDTERCVTSS